MSYVDNIKPYDNVRTSEEHNITPVSLYLNSVVEFVEPKEVSLPTLAFPADVSDLLPDSADIPKEFWDHYNEYATLGRQWFFGKTMAVVFDRPGINGDTAGKHITCCLRTYSVKHEHKEAGVGYLLYLWKARAVTDEEFEELQSRPETA